MRAAGIICECNPFHKGHKYLIEQARQHGANTVICVMSGCFTQRGEIAVLDPQTRARILLDGGADAVLELPFPHSSSRAESFAAAGISILDRLGVETLWFGSECGDLAPLMQAATLSDRADFQERYHALCLSHPIGTARAYAQALREFGLDADLSANDLLGVAYLRALSQRASSMIPHTVKRIGCGYHDTTLQADRIPSASVLRESLYSGGFETWREHLSPRAFGIVEEQVAKGTAFFDLSRASLAILSHFRQISPSCLEQTPELGGGLGRRLAEASQAATDLSSLVTLASTKKYTLSRIRRGILFSLLGVTEDHLKKEPAYAVLLAANARGCAFFAEKRRKQALPIVTSHAGIPHTKEALEQETLTRRAFALFTLCAPSPLPSESFLRASSYIERD